MTDVDPPPGDVVRADLGSFRDPRNGVFRLDGRVLRYFDERGWQTFESLRRCGVLDALTDEGLILPALELSADELRRICEAAPSAVGAIEQPRVPFFSYSYEWTFNMLRDAALLQLEVLDRLLEAGFILKDGQADNVQFIGSRPVFIDVGSIEPYEPGQVWPGYAQFCATYLTPLLIEAKTGVPFQRLLRGAAQGISVGEAARLLPWRTRLRRGPFIHVYLQAWLQRRYADTADRARSAFGGRVVDADGVRRQVRSLRSLVQNLPAPRATSVWSGYDPDASYAPSAREVQQRVVEQALAAAAPSSVWDVGCNTGEYSRRAVQHSQYVVAMDFDPAAVDRLYLDCRSSESILPLVQDIADPSPDQGWAHGERQGLRSRGPADFVLWLALSHHMAFDRAVPPARQAAWIRALARGGVVEFVPPSDPMVRRMLALRNDQTPDPRYTRSAFEAALAERFGSMQAHELPDSERVLYTVAA